MFRGRLVHSVGAHDDIEQLEDHVIGVKGKKVRVNSNERQAGAFWWAKHGFGTYIHT